VALPGPVPVNIPLLAPIVPTVPGLLLQVPPGVKSLNPEIAPWQITIVPVIAAGSGLTVNG